MEKSSPTSGFHDKGPLTPERLDKLATGAASDLDFHTWIQLESLGITLVFRISWCHLSACYTAEFVQKSGEPITVDVITWGKLHTFFAKEWYVGKLRGVHCDEHEDIAVIEHHCTPRVVQIKNRR